MTQKVFAKLILALSIFALLGAAIYPAIAKRLSWHTPASQSGKAEWRTYRNERYGFELKYPSNWRTNWRVKPNVFSTLLKNIGLIKEAWATPPFWQDLINYEGSQVFGVWFQNPEFDQKPILGEKYRNEPQYYQSSSYNSAPLGIFVYVFENGKFNESQKQAELDEQWRKQTIFKGLKAYQITPPGLVESPEIKTWATEKIEVETKGNLYLIFYAGNRYGPYFEELLSTFKFT